MGNIAMSGIPPEAREDLQLDYTNYPPWPVMWVALYMDLLCFPLRCRYSWRKYLPFGLGDDGGWLSEDYQSTAIYYILPEALTFENFRAQQGYNVTAGSSIFAGVHGWDDINDWLKSIYEYMFHTSSTSLSNLLTLTGLGTVAVLVLFIKVFKSAVMPRFQRFGRDLATRVHGDQWLEENEERIVKFGEYVFRLCYHSFISLVGFYCFWDAPWWDKDRGGTINLFTNSTNDPVPPQMSWYYLFQAAYNADAMVSLLQLSFQVKLFPKNSLLPLTIEWSNTVRGDFNEMLAHHIVTNALVFLSSYFRQTRIGSMVFWMHDLSDVPVDLAKLANFVKWKTATITSFVLLCIMWAYTRLYVLPFTIWTAIYRESHELMKQNKGMTVCYYTYQPVFLILLGVLVFLHFIWFSMFIKMGFVLITKGETHDYTEHKDGEEQDLLKTSTNGVTNGTKKKIS